MAESVTVVLTSAEALELALAISDVLTHDAGFTRSAPSRDAAFILGYLRLQQARLVAGVVKGIDLQLPPWASSPVLARLFPPPAKRAAAAPKPAKAARRRTPRKKRPSELRRERERADARVNDQPLFDASVDSIDVGSME
jgi:hypothetical protein